MQRQSDIAQQVIVPAREDQSERLPFRPALAPPIDRRFQPL
jgi:hypothetical protein